MIVSNEWERNWCWSRRCQRARALGELMNAHLSPSCPPRWVLCVTLEAPHYGLGGQIIKNAKGHKKLRQRAQNSGKTQDTPEVSTEILLSWQLSSLRWISFDILLTAPSVVVFRSFTDKIKFLLKYMYILYLWNCLSWKQHFVLSYNSHLPTAPCIAYSSDVC